MLKTLNVIHFRKRNSEFLLCTAKLILCITLIADFYVNSTKAKETIAVEIGKDVTLICLSHLKNITWKCNNREINVTFEKRLTFSIEKVKSEVVVNEVILDSDIYNHSLTVKQIKVSDEGAELDCEPTFNNSSKKYKIQPFLLPKIVGSSNTKNKQKIGHAVTLFCEIEVFPRNDSFYKTLKWLKDDTSHQYLDKSSSYSEINQTHFNYSLHLTEVYKKENGSYSCSINSKYNETVLDKKDLYLLVMDVPQVSIDFVKAVGSSKIFLNWTMNDGNDPIQKYFVQFMQEGSPTFTYYNHVIEGKNTSYVLTNFLPDTNYFLRISAKNRVGNGIPHQYPLPVRTLKSDPIFVPKVETTGSTSSTITIGWSPPPIELLEYIQFYELKVLEVGEVSRVIEEVIYQQNSRNLPYMFDNLKTATEYEFKVRACSDLTKICGPWSEVVNGTTMDGVASKPTALQIECVHHNISRQNSVIITWHLPKHPNGKIVSYLIHLEGFSIFKLDSKFQNETWGPKIRRVDEPSHKTIYDGVNPNTNYTVTVSAITRHRKIGETAIGKCFMPISTPDIINRIMWNKIKLQDNKCVFKVFIPKISEKNGPICCYRLYLLRMGNVQSELPPPEKLNISTYHEVHSSQNTIGGAYIAEMFSSEYFRSEIFLGDGKRFFENQIENSHKVDDVCRKCLEGKSFLRTAKSESKLPTLTSTTPKPQSTLQERPIADFYKLMENRTAEINPDYSKQPINGSNSLNFVEESSNAIVNSITEVFDGEIDVNSNYTGFLEVIVRDRNIVLTAYSNYFEIITPGTAAEHFQIADNMSTILNIIIQILAISIGVVLVFISVLCIFIRYNTKESGHGDDVIGLRDSLRALFGNRPNNHRHFINTTNPKISDIGPIHKTDLSTAYKNRHKDTDYGFLREYEMLPGRFSDRTTKNSDLKENGLKNRYPDIKAYDQTRVKLSQINGIQGSDYINANFVIGYKERKKFICAQGPMENTTCDFWRMIWEQHLEIIVMLTNLEEYNKCKCAKYWPEKIADLKNFGDISVKFVSEKKISDYVIRNLDIFKRSQSNETEEEQRHIIQYHYLVWKDFMAPEHPQGIIKFIRHINGVYHLQRGPILVHCSAGVGRTGTLVALDSLLQQLDEENQVAIYNTVCDLRHQRNFLVQSLKQYIFLYRALLEYAHFGNTELQVHSLAATVENLKNRNIENREKCKLEIEFEKLLTITEEANKSFTAGTNEENVLKNRSEAIVPFDRNRVILSPIPLKENSTYINASFIEGYDNSEMFIITQDPMENTIGDFWRMISEQSVTTLVMISEIGEGPRKCPRYWADDEIQYEHILVKYLQSESCPYYTRREFSVTNCKIDDTIRVTQFQYNGWPTVEGEVPEVCRGIIELVDQAQSHHDKEKSAGFRSPLTVHSSLGTDRSSIFVAMCILVHQLRNQKTVDICSISRKIRSQRKGLLNTYAAYEFLHRAIVNYADLHKLSSESSP